MEASEARHTSGSRQARRSRETRDALIATARRLFAERGYASVGTEEIVRESGLTRGALYHHFDDKRELFEAVFEQVEAEMSRRFAEEALSRPDPWQALVAGCDLFLEICREPEVQRIALLEAPSVLGWERWREIEARHGLGLVEAGLRAAIEAGAIAEQPVGPLAHVMLGALQEAGLLVARSEDPVEREQVRGVLIALLEGLRRG